MKIIDEIYSEVLKAVSDMIELPEGWMKSKRQDCTEARSLLVHYLIVKGMSRGQVGLKTGLSKTAIRNHANNYNDRIKHNTMMRLYGEQIGRKLGAN